MQRFEGRLKVDPDHLWKSGIRGFFEPVQGVFRLADTGVTAGDSDRVSGFSREPCDLRTGASDVSELGLKKADLMDVRGGGPEENARIAREVLGGAKGPRRDVVLLNASAALRAAGLAKDWKDGLGIAAETIDSGRAGDVLQRWAKISQA